MFLLQAHTSDRNAADIDPELKDIELQTRKGTPAFPPVSNPRLRPLFLPIDFIVTQPSSYFSSLVRSHSVGPMC